MTKHFSDDELKCQCGCGRMEITPNFLDKLEALRECYGKPIRISSGYRCPAHNAGVSHTGARGPHTIGAVDIPVSGGEAYDLLRAAWVVGFSGIGMSQHGKHASRFIHLDDCDITDSRIPRPMLWSY